MLSIMIFRNKRNRIEIYRCNDKYIIYNGSNIDIADRDSIYELIIRELVKCLNKYEQLINRLKLMDAIAGSNIHRLVKILEDRKNMLIILIRRLIDREHISRVAICGIIVLQL